MKKNYLLYDLSELPDNMTLDDVVKKYKEEKIILVKASQAVNSKVVEVEVTDEEIENEVNKRVAERVKKYCDRVNTNVTKQGQLFAMRFAEVMRFAKDNNIEL